MRSAGKVMLSVLGAVTAFALGAVPASATDEVAVVAEPSGAACTFATCRIHFEGEVEKQAVIFGFEVHEGDCLVEWNIEVNADGAFRTTAFGEEEDTAGTHDANCFHGPVAVAESLPWSGAGEEDAEGHVELSKAVDLDPTEAGECTGTLNLTLVEVQPEVSTASFDNARIGSSVCELTGQLGPENGTMNFHFIHE